MCFEVTEMPSNKDIQAAWEVHDRADTAMDCEKRKSWNSNLGHSRFNPACQAWVREYAGKHPLPSPPAPSSRPVHRKVKCDGCRKDVREDKASVLTLNVGWRADGPVEGPSPPDGKVVVRTCPKDKCRRAAIKRIGRKMGEVVTNEQAEKLLAEAVNADMDNLILEDARKNHICEEDMAELNRVNPDPTEPPKKKEGGD